MHHVRLLEPKSERIGVEKFCCQSLPIPTYHRLEEAQGKRKPRIRRFTLGRRDRLVGQPVQSIDHCRRVGMHSALGSTPGVYINVGETEMVFV